jgi:hypothetical protein
VCRGLRTCQLGGVEVITNHGQRPWYEAGPPEGAVNVR